MTLSPFTTIFLPLLLTFLLAVFLSPSSMLKFLWRLSQSARFQPTIFHPHPSGVHYTTIFTRPHTPIRILDPKTLNIDDRYEFVRPLGFGCEGCTAIYKDKEADGDLVVVKSFFTGVRKNPVPEHLREHFGADRAWWEVWGLGGRGSWPSEIPATLYFAGLNATAGESAGKDEGGFVYAVDYFWAKRGLGSGWALPGMEMGKSGEGSGGWKLVTPFLAAGTLETLAEMVKYLGMRPEEVDGMFRRRYRGVLKGLAEMHEAGYVSLPPLSCGCS